MITISERDTARTRAARMIERTGFPLRSGEGALIEVADFGLGILSIEGAQILTVAESPRVVVKLVVLFPGQTLPEHWHPAVGDDPGKEETIRVVGGSFALCTPGEEGHSVHPPKGKELLYTSRCEHVLSPGDQYFIPSGTKHWFQGGPEGAVAWSFTSVARDALDRFTDPAVVRKTIIRE